MPAKSRSQQRLFGMVHAYNKGEFRGSRSLERRIAGLAKHISKSDAEHFARTGHKGLPETKEAQVMLTPEQIRTIYGYVPQVDYPSLSVNRRKKRMSLLRSVLRGSSVGTVVGGLGCGALGAFLAHRAGQMSAVTGPELHRKMLEAGVRLGLWGAPIGSSVGAAVGGGLYVVDKIKGGDEQ